MSGLKIKNYKKKFIAFIASLVVSSLILYVFLSFQKEEMVANSNLERFHALSKLTDISKDLEAQIQNAIIYTDFFSIIISHTPSVQPSILQKYSSLALTHNPNIKSVQFAPNAIIQTVYPEVGNEAAIGHDLLGDPARAVFTKKAIDKKVVVLQGPVAAIQGGRLLFNRKAIFVEKEGVEVFWGLAIVAIDFDKLIENYQSSLNDVNYLFALRANNQASSENLYGPSDVFEKRSIIKSINLPETTWELAIYPKEGWKDEYSVFNYLNKLFYFALIIIFVLLYLTIRNYLEKLSQLNKDPLTGTLNKIAIENLVNKKLKKEQQRFALLIMDINGFKAINDHLGHYVGDRVLIEIAARLRRILKKGDAVSRFGGDEYIVILDNLQNDDSLDETVQEMIEEIAKPMKIDEHSLEVIISIGYAIFPNEATHYKDLYQAADKKMYECKKLSKE